jgi:hypothetical protein
LQGTFGGNVSVHPFFKVEGEQAHWPLVVRKQSCDAHDLALQLRTQAIHRVGNLTLLTKELNPSASNGPWSKKRDKILEHSALNLNRPFKDHCVWDEDLIEERSKTVFTVAVKIWPRPWSPGRGL